MLPLMLWLSGVALAQEEAPPPPPPPATPIEATLNGDVKGFLVASFPYPWITAPAIPPEVEPFLPEGFDADDLLTQAGLGTDPTSQGIADVRLKAQVRIGDRVKIVAHHAVTALPNSAGLGIGGSSSSAGVGLTAPELIDLTWQPDTGDQLVLRGRTDRLFVQTTSPGITLTLGRQPVTFGNGLFVTPMDVVNPFSIATIDSEYKPGIDAVRLDAYSGFSSRLSLVAAWAGSQTVHDPEREPPTLQDGILALNGQTTVGVTDLIALAAYAREEPIVGLGFVTSLGPVGVNGEATLTVPAEDAFEDDPFVRAVLGGLYRPTTTTTVSAEVGYQGAGASDPSDYLEVAASPRFARGEIWQLGQWYAGAAVSQEITPLLVTNVAAIVNVADPSMLLTPGLSWSVADNAAVFVGAFFGVGERPDEVPLGLDLATLSILEPTQRELARSVNSEFGFYPSAAFLQLKAYF